MFLLVCESQTLVAYSTVVSDISLRSSVFSSWIARVTAATADCRDCFTESSLCYGEEVRCQVCCMSFLVLYWVICVLLKTNVTTLTLLQYDLHYCLDILLRINNLCCYHLQFCAWQLATLLHLMFSVKILAKKKVVKWWCNKVQRQGHINK